MKKYFLSRRRASREKVNIYVPPGTQPRSLKARSLPYLMRPKVEEELNRLQREGIIQSTEFSEWATPIVPILKPGGKVKSCSDYKTTVNASTPPEHYPLPKIEDVYAQIGKSKYFSKLDLAHAYEQLELTGEAKPVTTISTHRGLFMFNRLPFGIHSTPSIFRRTIENVIAGIPKTFVYLDDILITGFLKLLLDRLKECGLRIKREKCDFLVDHVDYLGFRISADGLAPLAEKVRPILEAPQPRNKHELRSSLGMVSHYARFIPQAATLFHPLNYLLLHGVSWIWNHEQEKAFQQAKLALTNPLVLTHFDSTQPTGLACDASPYGVGALLSQENKSGILKPVAYASRSLSPSERNYAQIDKETLARFCSE
ncbi:reverse transcriptase [Opisthorchis viverrini]|uniref:Reverse transcriptase n=1 Tax=Opisthorchis viverrini TaxID=6198 RepID=A0A1S8WM42_OPIVI|nr:reverse transcriptase [Opisthorchis viverrini]